MFWKKTQYCHASVDIETLAVEDSAQITEIAITLFNVNEKLGPTYEWRIDWIEQKRYIDPKTVHWALTKNAVCERLKDDKGRILLSTALKQFAKHITKEMYIWANSPTFDLGIIRNAYQESGQFMPWDFRKERDLRTLMHNYTYDDFADIKNTAPHTASGDAQFQAKIIQRILQMDKK